MTHVLALDQGTTSSRALLFDLQGRIQAQAQQPFEQHFPQPGWVEHDPEAIWATQLDTARQALAGRRPADVAAIGLTNQRETVVLWERASGKALTRAIVWQDRRTAAACQALREAGHLDFVRQHTGLTLDPYFSATKIAWWLQQHPDWRARAERGELAVGTVDSWLLWRLTEGRVHATDVTNASRTLLMNLHSGAWDEELLRLFGIPRALLPEIRPSAADYGHTSLLGGSIAIGGVAGDQQAALFGQGCTQPGQAKNTYGTGCFLLMHTGERALPSEHGLLTTRAAQTGAQPQFALEGSVFMGGAVVQWLRDGLKMFASSAEVETLARSVPDSGGVIVVPAFTGLGAPYWNAEARGAILGLTRGSGQAQIARAALESIAFQSADVLEAMVKDASAAGIALSELRVDGGASANDLLMQWQADLLGVPVWRPAVVESTAYGAAALAAAQAGVTLAPASSAGRRFEPQMARAQAAERMAAWHAAVNRVL
ncbi:glycerol kinase GlpK [Inhella proteolytica]|uniref:Glycerol kinase n=1 Tax=Inhella proteolytica TaxID=2795029 RepID=A0A931NEZ0_9BURK|nr:glycerol kinase GlpK [Inhella proteolytica]MBH9575536.1 glycerol kinase GlpK [Inhella proteolytica]